MSYRPWYDDEDQILSDLYPSLGPSVVAKNLAIAGYLRSPNAVRQRARALGVQFVRDTDLIASYRQPAPGTVIDQRGHHWPRLSGSTPKQKAPSGIVSP